MANLIKAMKEQIVKSGSSKKEILYFGKDSAHRIRFLQELDAGFQFEFHNNWDPQIFELCKDPEDHENCKLCEQGIAIQTNFLWSVWDYDSGSVKLLQFKASGISPVPSFIEFFEEYGTMLDRDYKIKKNGSGQGSSFTVTPLDKERFSNKKAKPFEYSQVKDILEKAWAPKDVDVEVDDVDEEEEEEEKPTKKPAKKAKAKKSIKEKFEDLDEDELKEIALQVGLTKKEIRGLDFDELVEELTDNYEEEDLEEIYEEVINGEDEDDE